MILGRKPNGQFTITGFILPNRVIPETKDLRDFIAPVDVIEKYSGLLFFDQVLAPRGKPLAHLVDALPSHFASCSWPTWRRRISAPRPSARWPGPTAGLSQPSRRNRQRRITSSVIYSIRLLSVRRSLQMMRRRRLVAVELRGRGIGVGLLVRVRHARIMRIRHRRRAARCRRIGVRGRHGRVHAYLLHRHGVRRHGWRHDRSHGPTTHATTVAVVAVALVATLTGQIARCGASLKVKNSVNRQFII